MKTIRSAKSPRPKTPVVPKEFIGSGPKNITSISKSSASQSESSTPEEEGKLESHRKIPKSKESLVPSGKSTPDDDVKSVKQFTASSQSSKEYSAKKVKEIGEPSSSVKDIFSPPVEIKFEQGPQISVPTIKTEDFSKKEEMKDYGPATPKKDNKLISKEIVEESEKLEEPTVPPSTETTIDIPKSDVKEIVPSTSEPSPLMPLRKSPPKVFKKKPAPQTPVEDSENKKDIPKEEILPEVVKPKKEPVEVSEQFIIKFSNLPY